MKKEIYICDNCGKEAENIVPTGWYILAFAVVKDIETPNVKLKNPIRMNPVWNETHHFCSAECIDEAVKIKGKVTTHEKTPE